MSLVNGGLFDFPPEGNESGWDDYPDEVIAADGWPLNTSNSEDDSQVDQRAAAQSGRDRARRLVRGTDRSDDVVADGTDEEPFQAPDRFAAALSFGAFALEVVAGRRVLAALGNGDPVEGGVELAVAAAVESVALTLP
jgi:hypothetical protein